MPKLQKIDESNRSAHHFLTSSDECYFLHEFTARKGYEFSPGNQFIYNFKKSPSKRNELQYRHKLDAIESAIRIYRQIFDQVEGVYSACTFAPIPPSKLSDHPDYDDRMWRVVQGICEGKGADARELIRQTASYEAAHLADSRGMRIKPRDLQALYQIDAAPLKPVVALFDDVLAAGCHFRAAKAAILECHPGIRVVGFFLARRTLPNAAADIDPL